MHVVDSDAELLTVRISIPTTNTTRAIIMVSVSTSPPLRQRATVKTLLESMSFTTSLPKVARDTFGFRVRHVSLNVATLASKPKPPMNWTNKPGNLTWAVPLPRARIALTSSAVEVALGIWLVQPVPCCLLNIATPGAGHKEVRSGFLLDQNITMTANRALEGRVFSGNRVVLGTRRSNRVVLGTSRIKTDIASL